MADQQVAEAGRPERSGPAAAAPKYAWPEKPALLGTAVKRLDGPDKVTGRARYTYDINRPGMIYGRIVRSPYPHARVVSIDLSAAEKAPGVKAALAWKEPGAQVMYQGDPVAAVAADTEERARDAARLVRVRLRALPHSRPASNRRWRRTRRPCSPAATRARADAKRPAISTPASRRPRTSSRRPIRLT